jgi:hypothetical protein
LVTLSYRRVTYRFNLSAEFVGSPVSTPAVSTAGFFVFNKSLTRQLPQIGKRILHLSLRNKHQTKTNMTIKNITAKLTTNPSYMKKGDNWLAAYFDCSPNTIRRIKRELAAVKRQYISSL